MLNNYNIRMHMHILSLVLESVGVLTIGVGVTLGGSGIMS